MPRILCLDYGERRTGVAVSDETKTIAQGLPTIHRAGDKELPAQMRSLIDRARRPEHRGSLSDRESASHCPPRCTKRRLTPLLTRLQLTRG